MLRDWEIGRFGGNMSSVRVKFRVDLGEACAVGPGKIALLNGIDQSGSLSQAARDLKMSYRRAWELLESLNSTFQRPVADLIAGGRGGGGAKVTPFGRRLIATYREFEADLARRARTRFRTFSEATRVRSTHVAAPRRPLNLRLSTAGRNASR